MEGKEEEQMITLEDLENAKQNLISEIYSLSEGRKKSFWNKSFVQKVLRKNQESQD